MLDSFQLFYCPFVSQVARVQSCLGLNQYYVCFSSGHGLVLDAFWHHEELSLLQIDVSVTELDGQFPFRYEKQLIFVLMMMPSKLSLQLGELDVVVIELPCDLRRPVVSEQSKLFREVDFFWFGIILRQLG